MKEYKTKHMNLQLFAGENVITDLTGTTWELNSYPSLPYPAKTYNILFNSNNTNFTTIILNGGQGEIKYDNTQTFSPITENWVNQAYRTINITGGTDATNSTLISWLQANATQVQSGYESLITLTNCTCNKSSETGLSGSYSATITADDGYYLSSVTTTLGTATIATNKKTASIEINDIISNFIITATGTAKTIKNVILHPNNNGETDYTTDIIPQVNSASELEINRLFRTRYTITPTIINGTSSGDEYIWSEETASVTITPEENYSLPSSITVSGASYTYDSSSGVVSLSNATGNVSITAECEAQVTGYEVELQGYLGAGEYVYVQINDDPTWYYAQLSLTGFQISGSNIPNAYTKSPASSIGIPNVYKIKIGTQGSPTFNDGPRYMGSSTGDFVNLTFTSTGGSAPAYATSEITMTQDSKIEFEGDD